MPWSVPNCENALSGDGFSAVVIGSDVKEDFITLNVNISVYHVHHWHLASRPKMKCQSFLMFCQTNYSLFSDEVWKSSSNLRWLPASLDFSLWRLKHGHVSHTSRLKNRLYWTWLLPKRLDISVHYSWRSTRLHVKCYEQYKVPSLWGHQEAQKWRTNKPCSFLNEWFCLTSRGVN